MKIDISKLKEPYVVNTDVTINPLDYQNNEIKELNNLHVVGTIYYNTADLLSVSLNLTGNMILEDSVTLDNINYPIDLKIEEEYDINDEYFIEYYEKEQNILDIIAILWENIVLEVPISLTKSKDVKLSGDGWSFGEEKNEENIDPRLAKLNELMESLRKE